MDKVRCHNAPVEIIEMASGLRGAHLSKTAKDGTASVVVVQGWASPPLDTDFVLIEGHPGTVRRWEEGSGDRVESCFVLPPLSWCASSGAECLLYTRLHQVKDAPNLQANRYQMPQQTPLMSNDRCHRVK